MIIWDLKMKKQNLNSTETLTTKKTKGRETGQPKNKLKDNEAKKNQNN